MLLGSMGSVFPVLYTAPHDLPDSAGLIWTPDMSHLCHILSHFVTYLRQVCHILSHGSPLESGGVHTLMDWTHKIDCSPQNGVRQSPPDWTDKSDCSPPD